MMREQQHIARDGLRARLDGSVSTVVQDAKVLVVGLGSGGSQIVEALTRSSMEHFVVIDFDDVEAVNLSRSVYDIADVGIPKVDAISRHVQAINPEAVVVGHQSKLDDFDPKELAELISGADLVVAATDDPAAQSRLNRVAWATGTPSVFGAVYSRGSAGEVIFVVPGATACFRCATGGVRGGAHRDQAAMNYGTGQLVAEPALGADITHVVSAMVKIILGLVELCDEAAHGNSSAAMVLGAATNRRNFLQLSMIPDYSYFPAVFDGVPGQHAYQSVWLATERDPECPTCGDKPVPDSVSGGLQFSKLKTVLE